MLKRTGRAAIVGGLASILCFGAANSVLAQSPSNFNLGMNISSQKSFFEQTLPQQDTTPTEQILERRFQQFLYARTAPYRDRLANTIEETLNDEFRSARFDQFAYDAYFYGQIEGTYGVQAITRPDLHRWRHDTTKRLVDKLGPEIVLASFPGLLRLFDRVDDRIGEVTEKYARVKTDRWDIVPSLSGGPTVEFEFLPYSKEFLQERKNLSTEGATAQTIDRKLTLKIHLNKNLFNSADLRYEQHLPRNLFRFPAKVFATTPITSKYLDRVQEMSKLYLSLFYNAPSSDEFENYGFAAIWKLNFR